MTIGQNIRTCRKAHGLTRAKLGALCGITGASIGSCEKGATLPKRRVVDKIAAAREVSPDTTSIPLYDGVHVPLGGAPERRAGRMRTVRNIRVICQGLTQDKLWELGIVEPGDSLF